MFWVVALRDTTLHFNVRVFPVYLHTDVTLAGLHYPQSLDLVITFFPGSLPIYSYLYAYSPRP